MVVMAAALLAFLSGLGIGGGSLLVLWMTLAEGLPPETARVINLLFFLPTAAISCLFRWKQGHIPIKKLLLPTILGCIAAGGFAFWAPMLDTSLLKKLFGGLLIFTGLRELLYRDKELR